MNEEEDSTDYDQFTEDDELTLYTSRSFTGERGSNFLREYKAQVENEEQKKNFTSKMLELAKIIFSINPILYYFFSIMNLFSGILFFILIWSSLLFGVSTFVSFTGLFTFMIASLLVKLMISFDISLSKFFLKIKLRYIYYDYENNDDFEDDEDESIIIVEKKETTYLKANSNHEIQTRLIQRGERKKNLFLTIFYFFFNHQFGLGILYSIIKLPISIFIFFVPTLMMIYSIYGFSSPIVYLICGDKFCLFPTVIGEPDTETYIYKILTFGFSNIYISILFLISALLLIPIILYSIVFLNTFLKIPILLISTDEDDYEEY
eukprot:gene1796-938_t